MSLKTSDVTHKYGANSDPVLVNVSVTIEDGETVALMGPSGSGKSTLLSIIGGLLKPTAGLVEVDDSPLPKDPPPDLIGWVFQTVNALGRRTTLDNVAAPLLAQGQTRKEAEPTVRALLETVGLVDKALARAASLSGGELQRVCIARSLATTPRFVLADEPTGQLDHRTSERVLDALWAARPPHTSMVIATHDLAVAARCDRTVQLVDGKAVI